MNNYIKILGVTYTIKWFEENSRNDGAMGRADTKTATIHICNEMPLEVKKVVLLHECLHVISDMCELELSEGQVSVLASSLNDIIEFKKEE